MNRVVICFFALLAGCSSGEKKAPEVAERDTVAQMAYETEAQESDRILSERATDDEKAYSELSTYNGTYILNTESEGAEGTLTLTYNSDRTFVFTLEMKALDICSSSIQGQVFMDRTQHGLYQNKDCLLHFNFMGNWESGTILEIDQPESCSLMKGECTLTGRYVATK